MVVGISLVRDVRGRFLFTADERARSELPHHVPDWTPLAEAAGLDVDAKEIVPGFVARWNRLYALWLEHIDQIRALHGEQSAAMMEQEASEVGPTLDARSLVVVTCRRDERSRP